MRISSDQILKHNENRLPAHRRRLEALQSEIANAEEIIRKLIAFQVGIPSWALGTGGTRFGRFPGGGEPAALEQKIEDIGILHALNRSSGAVSLHIPWDIPGDPIAAKQLAKELGISFAAMNSNTFQDQHSQKLSYKFGSLCHTNSAVREQAIAHNLEVIENGIKLGSKSITIWLADGSNFPGQQHFRRAFERTLGSLKKIYEKLPDGWKIFTEHKPFEPNFYSSVVPDWGSSLLFAQKLGVKAQCLVDLGHHLHGSNIEQVVSRLLMEEKLGGFHFNDSKYADDDLTVGSLRPYQLFLIFNELVDGMTESDFMEWMIDASHNVKDPLEDLLQSVEAILLAYAQALCVDRKRLEDAQENNDATLAQEILQNAFRTDLRPLLAESRLRAGGAFAPVECFREIQVRKNLIAERGVSARATGL